LAGAEVVLAVRDLGAGQAVAERIGGGASVSALDLANLDSVRAFAAREGGKPLDLLINNAGVMACPLARTPQGFEMQLGVNHVGHYLLTTLLARDLSSSARVVSVSSAGHWWSAFDFEDPNFDHTPYDKMKAYGRSKTANVLFAVELDRRLKSRGVRAFSLHPGKILTPLQRHLEKEDMVAAGWIDADGNAADPTFKTPEQGAATQVWAATSPQLADLGGLYCADCDIASVSDDGAETSVRAYAVDPDEAARLWALSAELTHIDAFARS